MEITIIDNSYFEFDLNKFNKLGNTTYYSCEQYDFNSEEVLGDLLKNTNILVTCDVDISSALISKLDNLKLIATSATGYDDIDINLAKEKGIKVCNLPNYGTMSVAQAAIALLLQVTNKINYYQDIVKDNNWEEAMRITTTNNDLIELDNKTVGIIGYGAIGQATTKMYLSLGLKPLIYDPSQNKNTLDEVLSASDIISLHCPLTKDNFNIINKESISKMKDNVIIINTARGKLINSDDLYDALLSKKVAFAALDVVDSEPIDNTHKLLTLSNCIITPHIAWATIEARTRIVEMLYENIEAFLNNIDLNVVNN